MNGKRKRTRATNANANSSPVRSSKRRPLRTANASIYDQNKIAEELREIFTNSQHVTTTDEAFTQLNRLYNNADFEIFEKPFMDCLRKLLRSKQSIYFKTSCEFICKFLQHVINLKDDRLVRSCADVSDHYMQISDEDCRLNSTFLISKILSQTEFLDEEICNALKITLPKRIRDKKASIRAQAVLASRKFQDNKMIQEGFLHHFNRDPELIVRKALLQTMDVNIFGLDFLAESTQDSHEVIRKTAYTRLSKISPSDFTKEQLHQIIHNGLFERERAALFTFKSHTFQPWLEKMYDGIDLVKLLESFDVVNYTADMERMLTHIHERNLDISENNGTATKLHNVVEAFRERWLSSSNKCLPDLNDVNERVIVVWFSLESFCKKNQEVIRPVKIRSNQSQTDGAEESIEEIANSQERQDDEVIELYERLTPDLVNLIDFLKLFVRFVDKRLKEDESKLECYEFIYHRIMNYIYAYEIGDELERKTVQEVLGLVLRENLLTGQFRNFIPPIVKCLHKLIYSSSNNLMINYISEMIQNIRSHLEDLSQPVQTNSQISHSAINTALPKTPKSARKVTINSKLPKRQSVTTKDDELNLEFKIATMRVEIQELKDQLDEVVSSKQYDQAKIINTKIEDLQVELNLLNGRRYSIASDVSQMVLEFDEEPEDNKLSSTMLQSFDQSMDESRCSTVVKEEVKIFKHHTNELIKCLQMYYACLECVRIKEVPPTMLAHLEQLSLESLDKWFKNNSRVKTLMVACTGLTALIDERQARQSLTGQLLISACFDTIDSLEIKTVAFKSIVDIMVEHSECMKEQHDRIEKFINIAMRDYGKYNPKAIKKDELDFVTTIIEGTAKLYYYQKLDSPDILSHLILWWYHPRTYSKLTQFIGVFLPLFVKDVARRKQSEEDDWLQELLSQTFVTAIEKLHDYILGPGFNIMAESDMHNLTNFLCNLIPLPYHPRVHEVVDKRIDDLPSSSADLIKYLKQSKNNLATAKATSMIQRQENDDDELLVTVDAPLRLFE